MLLFGPVTIFLVVGLDILAGPRLDIRDEGFEVLWFFPADAIDLSIVPCGFTSVPSDAQGRQGFGGQRG